MAALFLSPRLEFEWGGFSHYILPALAAASLLAGVGLGMMRSVISQAKPRTYLIPILALVLTISILNTWWGEIQHVLITSQYPMATQQEERTIGAAAATLLAADEPLLVLGNAGLYFWAQRNPATRFFHYPGYFVYGPTGRLADIELQTKIDRQSEPQLNQLLISRYHLQTRLPESLSQSLWKNWDPIALFPYVYQRDVFLFTPHLHLEANKQAVAQFSQEEIELNQMRISQPSQSDNLLVLLVWQSDQHIKQPYTAFVHLLRPDGTLAAQHDGIPGVGFRPTIGWQEDELIHDYHWVPLPEGEDITDYELSIGLYNTTNGERLQLEGTPDQTDYKIPLATYLAP